MYLVLLFVFSMTFQAHAYIGPGAGFAVMGSFMAMFLAFFSAILLSLTWPIRYLIRSRKSKKALAKSKIKKCVILGLDGMDFKMTEKLLDEGKLPNMAKLREKGCFKPLATTVPSMSPVAWSSFQTGVNPGKHNIFDFLTRDKKTYLPKLSSVDINPPIRMLKFGKYQFPLSKADIRLLRKSTPFWKILGDHGIFSNVIRVPITFPPEKFYGVMLSGMCVPDLRGTQGTFSLYTTNTEYVDEKTGGETHKVVKNKNVIKANLVGPENPFLKEAQDLKTQFSVTIKDNESAVLRINKLNYDLQRNKYTDWIKVSFKTLAGIKISGICKFLLINTEPNFELYVTPINIDPEKPAMSITYPSIYSAYLSKKQGSFATLGLAEDSWALNENVLVDDTFLEQCVNMDNEREIMFFDSIDKVKRGLCVCVFDGSDRIQHTFWRDIDEEHPAHSPEAVKRNEIEKLYKRMDDLVGRTTNKCKDKDTLFMVISDHGFNSFRRGIDLNKWLANNGYLKIKDESNGEKYLKAVDWDKTKAFAIGLSGIFLNLKNRESQGIVEQNGEAEVLRKEIAEKLLKLKDTKDNQFVIKQVYNAIEIYNGPYKNESPDLLVGYNAGYRASWETVIGQITDKVFHDNTKPWSGDHCVDASIVPGIFFCNRAVETNNIGLIDIGPTVLNMFGVSIPSYIDGKPIAIDNN